MSDRRSALADVFAPVASSHGRNVPAQRELSVAGAAGEPLPRVVLLDVSASAGAASYAAQEDVLRARARSLSEGAGALHCSRSYRAPLALLAFHDAPVGVDVERVARCEDAFADSIQTPAERSAPPSEHDRDRYFSSLWSSKEALSKALGDPLAYDPRRLEGLPSWPQGRSGPWRAAPLQLGAAHVAWVCWRVS